MLRYRVQTVSKTSSLRIQLCVIDGTNARGHLQETMNKKWSSNNVKDLQRWLIKRWPESFTRGPDLRPLSLQIHKEILAYREENPQLSTRVLREVLKRHTSSYGYLYGMVKNAKRYNLKGEAVEEVSSEHREWARSALREKQKEAQRVRKESLKHKRAQQKPGALASKRNSGSSFAKRAASGDPSATTFVSGGVEIQRAKQASAKGPVIKYKAARRKIIKPAGERSVDLAS